MSTAMLRAIMKAALRLSLKPALSSVVPVALQRRVLSLSQAVTRTSAHVVIRPTSWDAVRGEVLTGPSSMARAVILYLHGGGYCIGSPATHRPITSVLALRSGLQVHVPDYRLAPEHPHPAALNDAMAVYRELIAEPGRRVILGGDSAGGGLALALALSIRDAGLPAPAALLLLSPWVDLACGGESMRSHAERDPMLSAAGLQRWASAYVGRMPVEHPLCSPLLADLSRLPPLLIQVGTEEVLYDDAERLHDRVEAAGGSVSLQVYPDVWHDFQLHAGVLSEANEALGRLADFARAALVDTAAAPPPGATKPRRGRRTAANQS